MCVKGWKWHHPNNQMCKATWILQPQQQLQYLCSGPLNISVVSKQLEGGEWNTTLQGMVKDLECVKKDSAFTCSYLSTQSTHSSSPMAQRGKHAANMLCSPLPKKSNHWSGYTSPQQPGAASRKHQAGSSQLWEVVPAWHSREPSLSSARASPSPVVRSFQFWPILNLM